MTKEIILLHQKSKANYEVTVNLVAEYDHALNIKIIIEEEIRSQNGLNAPLSLTGAKPEIPKLRSESRCLQTRSKRIPALKQADSVASRSRSVFDRRRD